VGSEVRQAAVAKPGHGIHLHVGNWGIWGHYNGMLGTVMLVSLSSSLSTRLDFLPNLRYTLVTGVPEVINARLSVCVGGHTERRPRDHKVRTSTLSAMRSMLSKLSPWMREREQA